METTQEELLLGKNVVGPHGWSDGPWIYEESSHEDGSYVVRPAFRAVVAGIDAHENAEANARLIAAAPDMHEALTAALPLIVAHARYTGGQGMTLVRVIEKILSDTLPPQEQPQ